MLHTERHARQLASNKNHSQTTPTGPGSSHRRSTSKLLTHTHTRYGMKCYAAPSGSNSCRPEKKTHTPSLSPPTGAHHPHTLYHRHTPRVACVLHTHTRQVETNLRNSNQRRSHAGGPGFNQHMRWLLSSSSWFGSPLPHPSCDSPLNATVNNKTAGANQMQDVLHYRA